MTDRPNKRLRWVGSSLEDIRAFPKDAQVDAGQQLRRLQEGHQPDRFKPMVIVGAGVAEIVIDIGSQFRVFYVAKLKGAIYVLHCFAKKTQQTSKTDVDLGAKRYKEAVRISKEEQ